MRIDAHVHYMPPELSHHLDAFCQQEPYWGLLVGPGVRGRSVQGWASAGQMIEDMERAGLDRVILQGEYRLHHEGCVARNDQGLAIIQRWPERVIAFATLQPLAGPAALAELRRCLDGGMRGVGELNPYAQGCNLRHPDFLRLVEACIAADIPLCLHTNEEVGPYYPGKGATPLAHYYQLACRYPELKLILAHWGGGLFLYELMPKVRRELRNVWYDTAASPMLCPTSDIFGVALRCLDHRKVLVASDYPLLLYPERRRQLPAALADRPDFRPFQAEVAGLNLPPQVYQDISGDNAARLLGLIPAGAGFRGEPSLTPQPPLPLGEGEPTSPVTGMMPVSLVADSWPATRPVFEKYSIPWQDSPVPFWEPIAQAAAARGYGPTNLERLLDELNAAIA
jgi:hypothetical protein